MYRGDRQPRRPTSAGALARSIGQTLVCGLAIGAAFTGCFYYYLRGSGFADPIDPAQEQQLAATAAVTEPKDAYVLCPPIRRPPVREANAAGLEDDAEVIGVCANGHARAYLARAMGGEPWRHVVNDLVGGQVISVTYCDRTGCCRVFTDEAAEEPLDLAVGGWLHNGLALHVGEADYSQQTGKHLSGDGPDQIPYAEHPYSRTTWKAWRQAHPDTEVYVGDEPADAGEGHAE